MAFILAWFKARLEKLDLNETLKDSKTRLQEFLQSRRLALPTYELINVEGEAHDQTFYIDCTCDWSSKCLQKVLVVVADRLNKKPQNMR